MCPRPWLGRKTYQQHLGAALARVAAAYDLAVVFVPFQERTDGPLCAELRARPDLADRAWVVSGANDPALIAGILGGAEFAVTMRLHSGILAAAAGMPAAAIDYDPKVRAFLRQTGQESWAVTADESGVGARASFAGGRRVRHCPRPASPPGRSRAEGASPPGRGRPHGGFGCAARGLGRPAQGSESMSGLDRPPPRQDAPPTPAAAPPAPEIGGEAGADPADVTGAGTAASTRATVGKAALIILAATVVGRVFGLVRDMAVAHFFGANATTDAFFLAYKIPYLLSLTVGGALTATFIPVFTQRMVTGRRDEAWKLTVSMTNTVGLVLSGLTVALIVLAPWVVPLFGPGFDPSTMDLAVSLFRILMPGVIFAGLAGLATGVLNSLKGFSVPAFSASVGAVVTIIFMAVFSGSWGINSLAVGHHRRRGGHVPGPGPADAEQGPALHAADRLAPAGHVAGGDHGVAHTHRLGGGQGEHLRRPGAGQYCWAKGRSRP